MPITKQAFDRGVITDDDRLVHIITDERERIFTVAYLKELGIIDLRKKNLGEGTC